MYNWQHYMDLILWSWFLDLTPKINLVQIKTWVNGWSFYFRKHYWTINIINNNTTTINIIHIILDIQSKTYWEKAQYWKQFPKTINHTRKFIYTLQTKWNISIEYFKFLTALKSKILRNLDKRIHTWLMTKLQ